MKFNLDSPEFNTPLPATPAASAAALSTADKALAEVQPYLEALGQHGGVYRLLDSQFVNTIVERVAQRVDHHPADMLVAADPITPDTIAKTISAQAKTFFKHLATKLGHNKPYVLNSALISHLTFPGDGRVYSAPGLPNDNGQVPAFMTFVGQFIDHDLTLNPFNLFQAQSSGKVRNEASAFIDLDSVYNRSSALAHGGLDDVFHDDGTFKLHQLGLNAYDLVRDNEKGMYFEKPYIFDLRNDENQMILQIHILLMRVHNELVKQWPAAEKQGKSRDEIIELVRPEVVFNWQRFILDDYLPTMVSHRALKWVMTEIAKDGHGDMQHKPETDKSVKMPHEFAISFRMGHTQLRDGYQVQPGGEHIPLFNNRSVERGHDLRGSQPLPLSHVIDWPFFSDRGVVSNKIDSHVTNVVFDLPQSAIPDKVKQVGNLPQRNLIRSSQVHLAAAEDLLGLYNIKSQRLAPEEVEPDPELRKLFQLDKDGNYDIDNDFRTPLWYYVIKEAELRTNGRQLGPLGGRIIAEVIAGGIYYQPSAALSVVHADNHGWKSKITGSQLVRFEDLVDFVTV